MSNIAGDLGTHPTHPYYNHGGTLGDSGHKNGGAGPEAGLPLRPPADVMWGTVRRRRRQCQSAYTSRSPRVQPRHPPAYRDTCDHVTTCALVSQCLCSLLVVTGQHYLNRVRTSSSSSCLSSSYCDCFINIGPVRQHGRSLRNTSYRKYIVLIWAKSDSFLRSCQQSGIHF